MATLELPFPVYPNYLWEGKCAFECLVFTTPCCLQGVLGRASDSLSKKERKQLGRVVPHLAIKTQKGLQISKEDSRSQAGGVGSERR